jgi:peptidoglycan/xylan/chitin deacetylase (PgdA/CDA1 family)
MNASGILFLMYHEIESPGRPLSNSDPGYVRYVVKEAELRRQLDAIRAAGFRGVTVGEALENLRRGSHDCVALTFDDGSETDLLTAAPMLRDAGCNATFFLVVGLLGTASFLNQNQLRELHTAGFEIGSHSMTHRHLADLPDDELREELQSSKGRLEQIIAAPVVHLSCPNGRWSPRVAQIAKEVGYQTISTSRVDWNSSDTDRSNLARLAVMRDTSIEEFSGIIAGAGLAHHRRKSAILGLAKRTLGNSFYDKLRSMLLGRS